MKKLSMLAFVIAAAGFAGCGGGGTDTTSDPIQPELGSIHSEIFAKRCTNGACHDASSPAQGLDLSSASAAHAGLVGKESTLVPGKKLVVPGDPAESFLMHKVTGQLSDGDGQKMPYGSDGLSDEQLTAIETWILNGATQ